MNSVWIMDKTGAIGRVIAWEPEDECVVVDWYVAAMERWPHGETVALDDVLTIVSS